MHIDNSVVKAWGGQEWDGGGQWGENEEVFCNTCNNKDTLKETTRMAKTLNIDNIKCCRGCKTMETHILMVEI